jgi:hypothetical protein
MHVRRGSIYYDDNGYDQQSQSYQKVVLVAAAATVMRVLDGEEHPQRWQQHPRVGMVLVVVVRRVLTEEEGEQQQQHKPLYQEAEDGEDRYHYCHPHH